MLLISAMRFAVSMHILNAYFGCSGWGLAQNLQAGMPCPVWKFDSSSGSGETFRRDSGPEGTEAKRTGKGARQKERSRDLVKEPAFFKRNLDRNEIHS